MANSADGKLILIVPSKIVADDILVLFFFCFFLPRNKYRQFMCIVCQANATHEITDAQRRTKTEEPP